MSLVWTQKKDTLNSMETESDPFEEGKVAAQQGKPASANPYPPDSDDHEDWAEGYDYVSGSDDDDDDEPIDDEP